MQIWKDAGAQQEIVTKGRRCLVVDKWRWGSGGRVGL